MFNKFTLIHEEVDYDGTVTQNKTTVEFNQDNLDQILEKMESFLKAVGFHFDGMIDIVNHENSDDNFDENNEEDFTWPEPPPPPPISTNFPFDNNMASSSLPDTVTVTVK